MKHGNALRRGLALVLSAAMAVSTAFAADGAISGSKRSSPLDENNTATIELSLPADQEQLETDVVFVIDKSTSTDTAGQQAVTMITDLLNRVNEANAKINIGVVIFNRQANELVSLVELNNSSMETIKDSILNHDISSGSNSHAGIMAGKAMLDDDTDVSANRKYLILVTDGLTYMFDDVPNAINSVQAANGENEIMAGNDCWGIRHYNEGGDTYCPDDWETYLSDVADHLDDVQQYIQPYDNRDNTLYIPKYNTELPTTVDVALYKTYEVFADAIKSGYNCYSIPAESDASASYPWSNSFMEYLSKISGKDEANFEDIKEDIWYLVNDGSTITDTMGEGEIDGHSYNFVIKSIESLKINDTELKPKEPSESENRTYTFVTDDEEVHSIITVAEDKKSFDWEIKQPITNFARVKLTYTVELQGDILGQEGTFGVYNEYGDGSENNDGLFTNASAILTTQDGREFVFSRPTVSYGETVIDPDPEPTPDPDPGDGDHGSGGDNDRYEGPDLTVVKVDEDGETIESNARFRIYKEQGSKTMWYKGNQSWSEDEEDAWIFNTSVGDGSFTAYDLKPGTYYIVEISAPEGYDLAEEPLEVEVESRDVTVEFVNSGDGVVTTPTKPVPDTGR